MQYYSPTTQSSLSLVDFLCPHQKTTHGPLELEGLSNKILKFSTNFGQTAKWSFVQN